MTIEINPAKWKVKPWPHQLAGVKTLIKSPVHLLAFEMRLGKSATVINTACTLFEAGELDTVVVVAPAQVLDVWKDRELGEIKTHCWVNYRVVHERGGKVYTTVPDTVGAYLTFMVTSLEYIRQEGDRACKYPKVEKILEAIQGKKAWLVIDEGSALGSPTSNQTRAVLQLRKAFTRVVICDGSPAGDSTKAVYSKMKVLNPSILGFKNQKEFLLRHAVYDKPGRYQRVIGHRRLEELTAKSAPYVTRVEAKQALNMPEKILGFLSVPLSPKTWDYYRTLRDEAIVELDKFDDQRDRPTVTIQHAPVMVLRLAQICAGFLGGVTQTGPLDSKYGVFDQYTPEPVELSSEAADGLLAWLRLRLDEDENFKCVVWSRWRAEIDRLNVRFISEFKDVRHGSIWGEVKADNFLHPRDGYKGPGVLVAQPQAAQYGVSFAKATTAVFLSQGYSLVSRQQCEDRVQAPNTRASSYLVDVLVTGTKGERTVCHDVRAALLKKENVALRTIAGWKSALEVE